MIVCIFNSIRSEEQAIDLKFNFSSQYSLQQAFTIHFLHGSFMKGITTIKTNIARRILMMILCSFVEDKSFIITYRRSPLISTKILKLSDISIVFHVGNTNERNHHLNTVYDDTYGDHLLVVRL